MGEVDLITDTELARAREDPAFRQQLLTENLERLLAALNKLRRAKPSATRADQVREGVELAVKLAERLRQVAPGAPRAA
jgi:hypothetical protein